MGVENTLKKCNSDTTKIIHKDGNNKIITVEMRGLLILVVSHIMSYGFPATLMSVVMRKQISSPKKGLACNKLINPRL